MKVLIDTNVILDVLMNREPYAEMSASLIKLCGIKISGCMTASQTTDIFYILRRAGRDVFSSKDILKRLTDNIKVLDINDMDVQNALDSEMSDYEDALLDCCAKRHKIDCIVTRNEKDFTQSQVTTRSPQAFLERYNTEK